MLSHVCLLIYVVLITMHTIYSVAWLCSSAFKSLSNTYHINLLTFVFISDCSILLAMYSSFELIWDYPFDHILHIPIASFCTLCRVTISLSVTLCCLQPSHHLSPVYLPCLPFPVYCSPRSIPLTPSLYQVLHSLSMPIHNADIYISTSLYNHCVNQQIYAITKFWLPSVAFISIS